MVPIRSGAVSVPLPSRCFTRHLTSRPVLCRNPDGLLWRPMPKEMVGSFQALAAKTTRHVQYGTVLGTIIIKAAFALAHH